ncbi:MAG: peptidylprolyl isomerase, partial [Cellulophaga sp.]|nr:peptidylprolyl isomerase [Cellulophaga sp.]
AVGAGRDDNAEKLSARCQFYIVQNKNGLHRLDGDYTIFGNVLKGMDIVDKLVQVPKDATNKPFKPVPLDISIVKISAKRLKELQLKK